MRILLDNAIGIAPTGSRVRLATATSGTWAEVVVSDGGPGVPEGERERIFERFQRGSTSGGRSGFGLGLAIGRELSNRMGGSLTLLDSAAQADDALGACFVLCVVPRPPWTSRELGEDRPRARPRNRRG